MDFFYRNLSRLFLTAQVWLEVWLFFAPRFVEHRKQGCLGPLHFMRGLQVALLVGSGHQPCLVAQNQALQRGLGVFVLVDLFNFSLVTHPLCGKQARTMQVEPAAEHLASSKSKNNHPPAKPGVFKIVSPS